MELKLLSPCFLCNKKDLVFDCGLAPNSKRSDKKKIFKWFIECVNSDCKGTIVWAETEEEAVIMWNSYKGE